MVGDNYIHTNGNLYTIIAESTTKLDGVWIDSITYKNTSGRIFNRLREDFFSGKFVKVKS